MKLAIVDFDDTLFFTSESCIRMACTEKFGAGMTTKEIRNLGKKEKGDVYNLAFTKYKDYSIPNEKLIERLSSHDGDIMVLTARFDIVYKDTEYLLKKHGISYDKLILKDQKSYGLRDEDWKLGVVKNLLNEYSEIYFYDDKEENVKHIKSNIDSGKLKCFLSKKEEIIEY
jgi:FMN phosphatase YigB (HAD superfamily)